jgi:pheganomycin biosynthesis PGM1-like protein
VIPKPPFACDLDLETEMAAFDALKPRLAELWGSIFPGDQEHYTSVVVPSLTLDQDELRKLPGASFYEERLLFLLIRLRNPRARLVYVTSQPIHPLVLDYYFQFLAGIPSSHARSRLTLLCAHDASPLPLTQKILDRPRLIQRIRFGIPDTSRAYLTVFNSTPIERKLAVLLGIPLNGVDPRLSSLGSKSGSRKAFREAGVECPAGFEDLKTPDDVARGLVELRRMRPGLRRAVVKLNESFSGKGNAIFRYPAKEGRAAVQDALRKMEFAVPEETHASYFDKYGQMGGVVEELVEDPGLTSPSAQLRINPRGQVIPIATHDQILGGPHGHTYVGCRFPAADEYRREVQDAALRVGAVLAAKGVVSRFSIDFLASPGGAGDRRLQALEINLRMGATTHPFLALRFLTGGEFDPRSGLFLSIDGRAKYYQATDNLCSEAYRGLLPEDLIDILTVNRLHYDHGSETGVLFHIIGALSEFGKVGLTAIGNTPAQAEALYARTVSVLDEETVYGRKPPPGPDAAAGLPAERRQRTRRSKGDSEPRRTTWQ